MDSIISLYKNPPKKIICDLIKMKDSILYILNVGLPKVYPLLFYFEKLTNQIQKENVSCVEAILIIEHYLHKMKDNIIKYEIESGFELINSIKKRLLLNHNVQLYQLASLFTPDGIVRYRKKMKGYTEYNIIEDENIYFKTLKNQNIIDQSENSEFILNNSNLINKFIQHNDTIDQFYDKFKSKKNWYIKSKTNKSTHNLDLKKSNKNKCVQKILTTYFQSYNESERTKIQNNIEDATKRYQMYKNGKRNEYISNKLIDLDENHIISSDDADDEVENEENLQNDTNTNEYNDKDKRKKEFELEESKDDIEEKLSDDEDSEDLEEEEEYDDETSVVINVHEVENQDENSQKEKSHSVLSEDNKQNENNKENSRSGKSKRKTLRNKKNHSCYDCQKEALELKNISNLIYKNAKYFDMDDIQAQKAVAELNELILMPFITLNNQCKCAICKESNFTNFWGIVKDFNYRDHKFENIAKLAMKMYTIPASEAGAERAFSKIKWRFYDRRNRASSKTIMNEFYIENFYKNKLESNDDYSQKIFELPIHKTNK